MESQVDSTYALVVGTFTAFLSFAFDLPAPAVFAAFIGACFGVAMAEKMTYRKAIKHLLGGTIAASLLASMFISYFGNFPQRGVAALLGFVLVMYWKDILQIIKSRLGKFQ